LDLLEYENLNDCIGKYLRVTVDLRRVMDIPQKYTFKTKAKYQFLDIETPFETKVVENKLNPEFNFKAVH
jgi:hypothetical protein